MVKKNITLLVLLLISSTLSTTQDQEADNIQEGKILSDFLKKNSRLFSSESIKKDPLESPGSSNSYHCTNGYNPRHHNRKTILEQFAKGPCNPVVVLPGIGGSRLQISIDCRTMRRHASEQFRACGWNNCIGGYWSPQREYGLWVPAPISHLAILNPIYPKGRRCFAALMRPHYRDDGSFLRYNPPAGVTVTPIGAQRDTRRRSECGFKGVKNLVKNFPNWVSGQLGYFDLFQKRLENLGYVPGLTASALPYDFRLDQVNDVGGSQGFIKMVRELKRMTNKKVVVVAHSMGNMRTYTALKSIPQSERDELFQHYIATAPPMIGAQEAIRQGLCGSDAFLFVLGLGLTQPIYQSVIPNFTALFQLMPSDVWHNQKEEQWMKLIKKRIAYERGEHDDPVFNFFPRRDDVCYTNFQDKKCISGLEEYHHWGSMSDGTPINAETINDLFKNRSFSDLKNTGFKNREEIYTKLPNLGIPSTVFMYHKAPTTHGMDFTTTMKNVHDAQKFCMPGRHYRDITSHGDGTVPSVSAILPFTKWAWEFEQGVPGAKPVKFLDYCSDFNVRRTPYDSQSDGVQKVTKNETIGMHCGCSQGNDEKCHHTGMVRSNNFLDFAMNTAITGIRSELLDEVKNMSRKQVNDYVRDCNMFWFSVSPFAGFEEED